MCGVRLGSETLDFNPNTFATPTWARIFDWVILRKIGNGEVKWSTPQEAVMGLCQMVLFCGVELSDLARGGGSWSCRERWRLRRH